MRALRKSLSLLPMLIGLASPAIAQMGPSDPETIARAGVDCWQSVRDGPVDIARLEARGWKAGSMGNAGKPVKSLLGVYGKTGSSTLIMLLDQPGAAGGCTVVSSVHTPDEIVKAAQALLAHLVKIDPNVKGSRQGQSIIYVSGPRAAVLEPTGSMEKPATRILIVYASSEKK